MKGLKRFLAALLAAVVIVGLASPAQAEAAVTPKIKKVKVYDIDTDSNYAFLQVSTSGSGSTQGFEYKTYVNGKLKKSGSSTLWKSGGKVLCRAEIPAYTACTVRVRVNRGGAWSKWSGYTAVVPPLKVTKMSTSGNSVILKWKKMPGATDYVVSIKKRSDSKWKKIKTCKGSQTKIDISGYDFYVNYDVRMIARKKVGSKYTGSNRWQVGYFYRYKTYK